MYSSLQTVLDWAASNFDGPSGTYPRAGEAVPFSVVNRVGGECQYPHDTPRYAVQFWRASDAEAEAAAFDCAVNLQTLLDENARINAVGVPEITQLGYIDAGRYVWQVSFAVATNIRE